MARRKIDGHIDQRNGPGVSIPASGRTEPYPDPPGGFDPDLVDDWHALWQSAIASVWVVAYAPLVEELLELRSLCSKLRRSGEIPSGTAMSRIGVLEGSPLVTARAQMAAGIVIVGSEFDFDDESIES